MEVSKKDIDYFKSIDKNGLGNASAFSPAAMPMPAMNNSLFVKAGEGKGWFPDKVIAEETVETLSPPTDTNTTDFKKYLLPAAAVGIGLLLLTKGKKNKSLSGMKLGLNVKDLGKKVLPELEHVALVAGGMIASQKFLDLSLLMDKLPENIKTNKIVVKMVEHQGAVKMVIGLGAATMSKNAMVKALGYGVAIGGLIKEIRTLTGGDTSWIPRIGSANNLLERQAANTVLGSNNPAMDRASNTVLGMVPPTTSAVGCADYGNYY